MRHCILHGIPVKSKTVTFHNPHYFQWLRNNGGDTNRAMAAGPCGGRFHDRFNMTRSTIRNTPDVITNLFRLLRHITLVNLPTYATNNNADANRRVRITYMMGHMTEVEFKTILQKREKDRAKKAQIHGILTMFIDVTDDILRDYFDADRDKSRNHLDEFEQIRRYTNGC